jgi:hypothetical protein
MKKYTLIFEDVQGNEIDRKEVWELNKKEAKEERPDLRNRYLC